MTVSGTTCGGRSEIHSGLTETAANLSVNLTQEARMTSEFVLSRRTVLVSAGGTALAICLAGCGAPASSGGTTSSGGSDSSGGTTVGVAEVPVGGGTIVGQYVVTQPTEDTFEAFSYLCTHERLPVQQVTDAAIVCGRHGSTFSLADGSVITGPATQALTAATVTRDGDTLTIS